MDGEALARIRHGVYALPSSDGDPDQDLRAAWLSTDPRRFADERARAVDTPVVSHASASALHRMGDLVPIRHSFTAPQRKQTRQTDIRYHRAARRGLSRIWSAHSKAVLGGAVARHMA